MGGDCLNTGCVPSQGADQVRARCSHRCGTPNDYGIAGASAEFDFAEVMERVQRVIRDDRAARLGRALHRARRRVPAGRGEDRLARGRSRSTADGKRTLTTRAHRHRRRRAAVRAADPGPRGRRGCLTSDTLWDLRELPRAPGGARRRPDRLRAGAGLRAPRLAGDAGRDAAAPAGARGPGGLGAGGRSASRRRHRRARRATRRSGARRGRREAARLRARRAASVRIAFDAAAVRASAASPNTEGYGLEELGIPVTKARTVETNEYLQTLLPEHLRLRRRRRARTSSRTPPRTRPGTPRSTRCSAACASSAPTTR